jgi:hypothetical protein
MRRTLRLTLAGAVLLGAVALSQAAPPEETPGPAITISCAGYDKLKADLNLIGELVGRKNFGDELDEASRQLTQAYRVKGRLSLATKEPWGGVLTVVDTFKWETYAFFPATDIVPLVELFRELAKPKGGMVVTENDGLFKISTAAKTVYATQEGQWAYFSDSAKTLKVVKPDPRVLLGDLPKRYDLAIRLSLRDLPQEYRDEAIPQVRQDVQLSMDQWPGESEEQYTARLNLVDHAFTQLQSVMNELDDVLLGWNLDTKEKSTYLDVEVRAKQGTRLAERFAQIHGGKSDFAALLSPAAALNANVLGLLTDDQVKKIACALAELRGSAAKEALSADEREAASQFLAKLIGMLEKTAKNKKLDTALSLSLDGAAATLVAGTKIIDAAALEQNLRQLAASSPKNGKAAERFTVHTEPYQGASLYTISLPTPYPSLVTLVGKRLEIVLAISGERLLVAAGRDALPRFKAAFERLRSGPGQDVPPLQIRLAVPALASLVATLSDNKSIKAGATILAGFGMTAGPKNHVSFTLTPIARGVRVRLHVEAGLLKMFQSLNELTGWIQFHGF